MSSADWEEIKALAADFQRAQLTSASQRLTEKNCIEIVNKLLELKLLDVVYTADGKEYVTPQQLTREIQGELFVHGGRLSLATLASNLNVGLSIIEARVGELLKHDKSTHLVLGNLITSSYIDGLAEELNEKLAQDGMISLSELSKTSDLPGEFLQEQVEKRLGKVIHGKQDKEDPTLIYTETFVRRNTARIRGILSAVTKPTPINQILIKFGKVLPEKLFFGIVDKLITSKRIEGIISGGGSSRSAYYIPSAYTKAQIGWIEGFMNGNGYVDLDAASRLGISDPKSFITKRFPGQELLFLRTCVLGEALFKQVREEVEESLASPGWVDVSSILPVSVTEQDVYLLMDKILAGLRNTRVFDSIVVNSSILEGLKANFKPLMGEKASKDISSGKYIQLVNEVRAAEKKAKATDLGDAGESRGGGKKDDRRKKAAAGKAGGGAQGRETKTKSTKKKYMAGKKGDDWSDSEDEASASSKPLNSGNLASSNQKKLVGTNQQLEFQSVKEIRNNISKAEALAEAPQELLESISQFLQGGLQEEYQSVLKEAFEAFMSEKCGKKSQEEVLEKLFKMTTMLGLYIEGLENFEGDLKNQLEKFLLKSFGQEIVVAATTFLLMEAGLDENSQISDLPPGPIKDAILSLGKSPDVESYSSLLSAIVPPVKKSSKASSGPKIILAEARASLEAELEGAEPALFLHIGTLLLFSYATDTLIQASGKFVPQLINFLGERFTKAEHNLLKEAQEKVVGLIKAKNGPGAEEIKEELASSILPGIKKLIDEKKK